MLPRKVFKEDQGGRGLLERLRRLWPESGSSFLHPLWWHCLSSHVSQVPVMSRLVSERWKYFLPCQKLKAQVRHACQHSTWGGGLKHNLMFSGGFYCSFIWETRKNICFDIMMRLTPSTGTLKFLVHLAGNFVLAFENGHIWQKCLFSRAKKWHLQRRNLGKDSTNLAKHPPKWWGRHLFHVFSIFGWVLSKYRKLMLFEPFQSHFPR